MNIRKLAGLVLYNLIGRYLPVSHSCIQLGQTHFRRWCGRLILSSCGRDVNIERGARFSSRIRLGDRSGIGINARIGVCTIGSDVMMGPDCIIYSRNHRFDDPTIPMNQQGFQSEAPVTIGDDVWIGGRVIILPGVTIGSHCVIGAGSVVAEDIPDWAVAVGNPATVKKYRCPPDGPLLP